MAVTALVCLIVGALLGGAVGYLVARNRVALSALGRAELRAHTGAADADLAARQQAIAAMVTPMHDALDDLQAQLRVSERDRLRADSALEEHLAAMRVSSDGLRTETAQLVNALRAPQIRGRWGELQLERVVEAAGMVAHVDYVTQHSAVIAGEDTDRAVRPDMVVTLVGGRQIVIDAKVAFAGYLQAMEAQSATIRAERLAAHARQLRNHVESLSKKSYWNAVDRTPEFVVCFVPADVFLDAALREDPSLLEFAFERNVVIATPTTLIALLRTIAYTWRQDALAANAAQVSQLGRELYQRITVMSGHLDKVGRSLTGAVAAFNASVGTFESRVLVSARRLADLSVVDNGVEGMLDSPDQILSTTRSVAAEGEAGQVR